MPSITFWARLLLLAAFCHIVHAADAGAPTQGYVLANLPGAEPADTLILESLQDKARHRLAKLAGRDGNAVGLWLPPGDYKLYKWRDGFMPPYPTITVMAGRLTDMGSLVPIPVGDNDVVLLPLRNDETARNAQAVATGLQAQLQSTEPLPWRVERVPPPSQLMLDPGNRFGLIPLLLKYYEARANAAPIGKRLREAASIGEFTALAKLATPPLTQKLVNDTQGRSYFGAALGQIRVRDADGTWSALDSGSLQTVTAVAASAGLLLAGFEDGQVRSSSDGGATWKAAALAPGGAVVDISRIGEQWLITTARGIVLRTGLRSVDQMGVYAARAADLSDLAKLREFPVETEPLVRPSAAAFANFYYVNAYPKLWRLDAATQQWQAVGPDTEVSGFQVAPGNGTLAAYRIRGAFSRLYVSTDHGGSWRKADNPPYVIMDVRFVDADAGQAVRWNTGAFSGVIELLQYDRSKDGWTKAVDAPVGCVATLPDASHRARFCVARGGNILSYADGKWTAEFAVD